MQELEALKADIDRGLAEVAASRVRAFDVERIDREPEARCQRYRLAPGARGRLLVEGMVR